MDTAWLRVTAPFAAFRWFQAGAYRATTSVMPPSVAFGLVLNLAGIEMRGALDSVTTAIRPDLPRLRIATGLLSEPGRASLYQQLHSYPVGTSGKDLGERSRGAKYWIVPVRREILVDYDGIVGLQSETEGLLDRICEGLAGLGLGRRYGLPFAGDNNFLIDRIDLLKGPPTDVRWFCRVRPGDPPRAGSCRLTVGIDRSDNSKTTTFVFAPHSTSSGQPPESAWTWTPF